MQAASISSIGYWQVIPAGPYKNYYYLDNQEVFSLSYSSQLPLNYMDWYLFSETGVGLSRSLSSKRPSERGSIYCWGEFCAITPFIKLPGNLKFSSVFIDWSLVGSRSNWSGWLIINLLSYWFFFFSIVGWLQQIPSYSMHFYGWKT